MPMNGLGLLSPNEGRAFELAPGERIRHWPKPPAPPNPPPVGLQAEPTDCEGCGAPLQRHLASCAWCTRPHPSRRADLGALLEVTCLGDVAPRYVVGWEPTRPVPPPSRLVQEGFRLPTNTDLPEIAEAIERWRAEQPVSEPVWWFVGCAIAVPTVLFAIAAWMVNP